MSALRVLIADDEGLAAFLLRTELKGLGCCVVGTAHNGLEALTLCGQHHPEVVFMDVQMPEMDGLEATRTLMLSHPVCVLLVTAQQHLEQAAEEAGAMGYHLKPLISAEIPAVLEAARTRFRHFLDIVRRGAAGASALPEWLAACQAVRVMMQRECLSEEAAFARLSEEALASPRTVGM